MENAVLTSPPRLFPSLGRLFNRPVRGPVGLDISMNALRLMQIAMVDGNPYIQASATVPLDIPRQDLLKDPALMMPLIRQALREHDFHGRRCIATLPGEHLKLRVVNYEKGAEEDNGAALAKCLQDRMGDELGNAIVDYLPIRPENPRQNSRSALVAIADRNFTLQYLEMLNSCGLRPEALEIGPVALRRLLCSMYPDDHEHKQLLINFGDTRSFLTVLWGRRILMDREVDFGIRQIRDELATALDLEPKRAELLLQKYGVCSDETHGQDLEAQDAIRRSLTDILSPLFSRLASDVRNLLIYTASETRGGAIEEVILLGSLARIAGIEQTMDRLLSIPVRQLDSLPSIDALRGETYMPDKLGMASSAVAVGLALRGLVNDA